jgi:hypothetical protein
MNGPLARALQPWIARATGSLPEPTGPEMHTGSSEAAAATARSITSWIAREDPTIRSLLRRPIARSARGGASRSAADSVMQPSSPSPVRAQSY